MKMKMKMFNFTYFRRERHGFWSGVSKNCRNVFCNYFPDQIRDKVSVHWYSCINKQLNSTQAYRGS